MLSPKDCTVPPVKLMPTPLPKRLQPPMRVVEAADVMPLAFDTKWDAVTSTARVPAPTLRPESVWRVKSVFDICALHDVDERKPMLFASKRDAPTVTSTAPPAAVFDARMPAPVLFEMRVLDTFTS